MRTLTFEAPAWVLEDDLHTCLDSNAKQNATRFQAFSFDASKSGYVRVGTMRVEVSLMDEKELRLSTAESLRSQIDKVRADAQNAITELTRKLNEVLAIEHVVKA